MSGNPSLEKVFETLKQSVYLSMDKQIQFLSASIAFYAFAALLPLLLAGFVIVSVLAGDRLAAEVLQISQEFVTPTSQDLIYRTITDTDGRFGVLITAAIIAIWCVFRLLRSLDIAFSIVYDTEMNPPLLTQLTSIGVLFSILVLAGIGLIITTLIFTIPSEFRLESIVSAFIIFLVLSVLFFFTYYYLPEVPHTPLQVLPGTITATVLWSILNIGYGVYASHATQFELYGVFGGVLLLLVWFYASGIIIVFGAVINGVIYKQSNDPE